MKGVISKTLLVTAAIVAASAVGGRAGQADYTLTILHTNDFHSRFEPDDRLGVGGACSAEKATAGSCFGGSARLMTAVTWARVRAENFLLVDAGDQFPAGIPTPAQPVLLAELMNRMGYDAMAVGNHEFDEGAEVLAAFVDAVEFPVLMANADLSGEPLLAPKLANSVVIERGGEKLGLIGVITASSYEFASPKPNVVFTDPVLAVQAEAEVLTTAGVNKIIVLSHCGHSTDRQLALETVGIDVIVGGHSHTLLSNMLPHPQGPYPTIVNGVPIVHAYPYGDTLGVLLTTFDESGRLIEAKGDQMLLDSGVPEDEGIKELVAETLMKAR